MADAGASKAAMPPPSSPVSSTAHIAGVVALYWFVSIAMVFLNKHLLSNIQVRTRARA